MRKYLDCPERQQKVSLEVCQHKACEGLKKCLAAYLEQHEGGENDDIRDLLSVQR